MGELGLFFRLCPISFIGKSLVNLGGQNPIEPAKLKSAILFGPHMDNFSNIADYFLNNGGAKEVRSAEELARAVQALLVNEFDRKEQIGKALDIANSETDVLSRVLAAIEPFVIELQGKAETQ